MPDPVTAVGAGVGLIGSSRAASAQRSAANTQAQAQLQAAQLQADLAREAAGRQEAASRFRPVGVSTRFGTAQYEVGPEGYLTEASYQLDPQLRAQQEQLMGALPGQLSRALATDQFYGDLAGQYQGLGQQALGAISLDPMQAAQERTQRLEALAQPGRAEAQERLFSGLAAKGLTGLAVESGTGARVNPYMAAQQQEFDRQRALTAAESFDRARQDIRSDLARAEGLFGAAQTAEQFQAGRLASALSPYQTLLAEAQGLEGLGGSALQSGLDISEQQRQAALSGAGAAARGLTSAGSALGTGMTQAAATRAQAANLAAQRQAAMFGGIGSQISQLDFNSQPSDSGFRFYNTPATNYANNFNFSLPPSGSSQTAFAVPNYAPPSFANTPVAPTTRTFGAGANQPLFISP